VRAAEGVLFALRGYLALGLLLPFAFLAALVLPVKQCWAVGHTLAQAILRLAGIPLAKRGALPGHGPVVIASNHTSYFDALVLIAALDRGSYSFVAKREFLGHWVMRTLLAGFGTLFVERFDVAKSAEQAGELVEATKRGAWLLVFPEGTLRRAPGLMAFRTGAFQAAAQAGVPVVPVALRGVRSVLRDGTWYLRRAPITVTIGAAIAPDGADWAAAVKLRDAVRAQILQACGEPDVAR